ncbi:SDR family oxidoreductase [Myxococcota bacterium]|nr:SDR family oxidoreductase [Myxococcota bacterium]
MFDFTGQRVIVTGGTRGIGAAITRAFLDAGASVTAIYASNEAAAKKFADETPGSERLKVAQLDVADHVAVEKVFGELDAAPEVVVNNAGIRRDAIVGMMREDDWRRVMAVNLDGTFHVSKAAIQLMSRKRYGRIINIVSPSAYLGFAGQANYAASKAGQIAMAKALSKEVAKRNITVNCVSPGFIDTELLSDLSAEQKAAYVEMVPMKRFGTAAEVAHAVLFLASKQASYVTGATLEVTGGI